MTCLGIHTLLVSFNRRTATLTGVGSPCLRSLPAVKVLGLLQFSGVSRNQVLDLSQTTGKPFQCVCVSLSVSPSTPSLLSSLPPSVCVSLSLSLCIFVSL